MARSSTKNRSASRNSKGKGAKGPKVAFTKSAQERNVGSNVYIRLDTDEKFVGYALFDPDPAAENNPGYVEYGEHWDQPNTRFVPCWGAKNGCIYCKAGQQASQRALAAFLVTEINGDKLEEPEIRLFRMNWTMIQEWTDTLDEDGSTFGQKVRIKCVSRSDGDYTTKFFEKDRLSKKEQKAATSDIPEIQELLQRNLDRALEALRVSDILEDDGEDDDDEEEETPKAKSKSKTSKKNKKDEEDEDEDDEEEEDDEDDEDEDEEESEDDDEEEDDDDDSEDDDDDEDEDEEEEDEEAEDDDEEEDEDEDSEITGEYTVVSGNEEEMTVTLKELDSDLYFDEGISDDVDFDLKKGTKVEITATKDDEGDWVATAFAPVEKKSAKGGKGKGSKKKK